MLPLLHLWELRGLRKLGNWLALAALWREEWVPVLGQLLAAAGGAASFSSLRSLLVGDFEDSDARSVVEVAPLMATPAVAAAVGTAVAQAFAPPDGSLMSTVASPAIAAPAAATGSTDGSDTV